VPLPAAPAWQQRAAVAPGPAPSGPQDPRRAQVSQTRPVASSDHRRQCPCLRRKKVRNLGAQEQRPEPENVREAPWHKKRVSWQPFSAEIAHEKTMTYNGVCEEFCVRRRRPSRSRKLSLVAVGNSARGANNAWQGRGVSRLLVLWVCSQAWTKTHAAMSSPT
jgi:hypothetical protein